MAQRLGEAGARVLLSSRRQPNVDAAVQKLRAQGLEVSGVVCHVGQPQDRQHLVQTVRGWGCGVMRGSASGRELQGDMVQWGALGLWKAVGLWEPMGLYRVSGAMEIMGLLGAVGDCEAMGSHGFIELCGQEGPIGL